MDESARPEVDPDAALIGARVRAAREKLGLNQSEFARIIGTSQPQVRRLELGERTIDKTWALKIAPHIGMSPEEILFGRTARGSAAVLAPEDFLAAYTALVNERDRLRERNAELERKLAEVRRLLSEL